MTYKQAFDRLTEAYIAGNVNPFNPCSCFVGNLLGTERWISLRTSSWTDCVVARGRHPNYIEYENYTNQEIIDLEHIFMKTYSENHPLEGLIKKLSFHILADILDNLNEDALYKAFSITLDKLKEIHISKGEIIDKAPVFIKRQLMS